MAKKKKYKMSKEMIGLSVLVVLVILFAGWQFLPRAEIDLDYNYTDNETGAMTAIGGVIYGGSGGGGGGAPAPTGGEEGCVGECPAVWVEDAPIRSPSRGGILDAFGVDRFVPALTTGEWTCEGKCKNEVELCIFDPTDVVPANGYVDPNNPPECVCLKPQAGGCNFYDANYGVGDENIKCGGSCPYNSQCMRYTFGDVEVCRCLYNPYAKNCGLHYPEQYLKSSTGELVVPNSPSEGDCYGMCDITTICTFDYQYDDKMQAKVPICYCPESPVQDDDVPDHEIRPECETIKNPMSQKECDIGACKITLYGVECLFSSNQKTGETMCYCGLPEDFEVEQQDDKLLTTKLTDTLSSKLDYFIR